MIGERKFGPPAAVWMVGNVVVDPADREAVLEYLRDHRARILFDGPFEPSPDLCSIYFIVVTPPGAPGSRRVGADRK